MRLTLCSHRFHAEVTSVSAQLLLEICFFSVYLGFLEGGLSGLGEHTAISEKGLHFIATITEEAYAQKMRDWQRMVAAAIRR